MKKKKFRKKGLFTLLLLCLFIMSASVTVSAATNLLTSVKQAKEGTWKRDTQGRKYVYTDGRYPKSRWLKVKGKCYSFDAHGYVETGWKDYKGERYYLSEVKGKEGQLLTGLQKVKGKTYYLSKTSGQLLHGWQMINGKRYYFGKKTGAMSKKKWIGSRYVSADGSVTKVKQTSKSRLIILGDCRVASMRDCRIGNAIYIGKVSMGYNWLKIHCRTNAGILSGLLPGINGCIWLRTERLSVSAGKLSDILSFLYCQTSQGKYLSYVHQSGDRCGCLQRK